jgi:hypothetical protein
MKKLKFYTQEELNILDEFAKSQAPLNKKLLGEYCKQYDRSIHSVTFKVYDLRKKLGVQNSRPGRNNKTESISTKTELTPTVKDQSVVNIGKGEFNIPIKSWSITQHTDGFYFNVKF